MGYPVASETLSNANAAHMNCVASFATPDEPAPHERRTQIRTKVLKAAKIILNDGHTVFNCLVLDESPEGVFVDLGALVPMPNEVIIRFSSGATFRAVRRWNSGTKFGFQFNGPQIISHETAQRLQTIHEVLVNHGVAAAFEMLRIANFFDNSDLHRIAEAAMAAQWALESALRCETKRFFAPGEITRRDTASA
jgi:hypothetical protein